MTAVNWTPERVEKLTELYATGISFSRIASAVGGISRNACIGRVSRMIAAGSVEKRPDLTGHQRTSHLAQYRPAKTVAALKPEPPTEPLSPLVLEDGSHVTLLTLASGMCKFPINDPRDSDFHFCAHPSTNGVYCGFHRAVVFQPQKLDR